jgi:redox-sensitive bicupin YhaK (pirin superfamily)
MPLAFPRRRLLLGAAAAVPAAIAVASRRDEAKAPDARAVIGTYVAQRSRDGAGVNLRRALGGASLSMLDPFLLLDEMHSANPEDFIAGFPEHPHRGFETVTYMIGGAVEHADSLGNRGKIGPGAIQWMTAGRGVVHAEMPKLAASPELWGFQLWVNLPRSHKMTKPRYQDIEASAVPELDVGDARVRLLAGKIGARRGPVDGVLVQPTVADVTIPAGGRFALDVPADHAAFAYVLAGVPRFGGSSVPEGTIAVFGPGPAIAAAADQGARFLVCAAAPIKEPVARRGPFVMNTDEEIRQAFEDYRSGRLAGG